MLRNEASRLTANVRANEPRSFLRQDDTPGGSRSSATKGTRMAATQEQIVGWQGPGLEREVLESSSLDVPWAAVERFSALVRSSGSEQEREAVDYLIERLHAWDVPNHLYEPTCFISIPLAATLRVDEAGGQEFHAKMVAMSVSTDGEEVSGELVYVPPRILQDVADD